MHIPRNFIDSLGDGVIVLDRRGRIVELNPAAQEIFGQSLSEVLGRSAKEVLCPSAELIDLCRKPGEIRAEFSYGVGVKRYYDGYASPLLDSRGRSQGRAIVLRDITERKNMENELRDSVRTYQVFVNSLPETVWETDLKGWLTRGNSAGLEKFGYTEEELAAGINVFDLVAPEFREAAVANFKERLSGGQPTASEYVGLRKDGSRFPIVISSTPVIRGGVTVGLTGVLVDISERKKIEALLLDQHRAEAILEGHEKLAGDVAEVLHGRVQNLLFLALHQLDACELTLQSDRTEGLAALAGAKKLIEEIRDKEIRQISHRLHPSIVDLGLIPAVRSLADAFDTYFRVKLRIDDESLAKLDDPLDDRIPASIRLAVYRILEEALSNARKHSQAREVEMSLSVVNGQVLSVSLQDDGCGFETDSAERGLGLKVIAGRARLVGGTAEIVSAPGRGTRIELAIPLPTGILAAPAPTFEKERDHGLDSGVSR